MVLVASCSDTDKKTITNLLERAFKKKYRIINIEPIAAEASHRRYFRIHRANTIAQAEDNLQSIIVVLSRRDNQNEKIQKKTHQDFLFLSEFLAQQNIPVPQVIFAENQSQPIVIQTDVGTQDLAEVVAAVTAHGDLQKKEILIKKSLDLALQFTQIPLPELVKARSFDYEKLQAEMNFLFTAWEKIQAQKSLQAIDQDTVACQKTMQLVCRELADARQPLVFVHRDFHSKNIMLIKENNEQSGEKLTAIDYQDARAGLMYYDLVSLIYDPYLNNDVATRKMAILYVLEKLANFSKTAENSIDLRLFYLQALQRLMKAMGTYLYQHYHMNHTKYFSYILICAHLIFEIFDKDTQDQDIGITQQLIGQKERKNIFLFLQKILTFIKETK